MMPMPTCSQCRRLRACTTTAACSHALRTDASENVTYWLSDVRMWRSSSNGCASERMLLPRTVPTERSARRTEKFRRTRIWSQPRRFAISMWLRQRRLFRNTNAKALRATSYRWSSTECLSPTCGKRATFTHSSYLHGTTG